MYNIWIIFLVGITGIWKSIPLGFVLEADPFLIGLMTILGAWFGIFVIYILGSRVKKYIMQRMNKKGMQKKSNRVKNLFEKYGTIGLGMFGTLIIGPNATMAVGLVIVRSEKILLFWTSLGIVVWSVTLTLVASYSIGFFQSLSIF